MRIHNLFFRASIALLVVLCCGQAYARDPNPATLRSDRGAWPLYRQWNLDEVRHFSQWIAHIYERKVGGTTEQRLAKLDRVLTDPEMNLLLDPAFLGEPANPQVDMASIRAMHRVVDCHKLVMSLAAYYSCRRGLPFMFSVVRSFDGTDIRTAPATYPVRTTSSFDYPSAHQVFVDATVGTCTGNLRVPAFIQNSEWSDTCPVTITRDALIPGTFYYLDGHVLVLARVEPTGNIRFLDATVSPTRDLYTAEGMNVVTGISPARTEDPDNPYAKCFRGFRMLRYPIAETDDHGNVMRVRRRTDAEMEEFGFSTEQYDKMAELMAHGRIVEDGFAFTSMHQFIRHRLRAPAPLPIAEMLRDFADRARHWMEEREALVQAAHADVRANGPVSFPDNSSEQNIYTTGGRWGRYATALTDTEFRGAYFRLLENLDAAIQWIDIQSNYLDLDGFHHHAIWSVSDLAWGILNFKERLFKSVQVTVVDSSGRPRQLTLGDVEARLYALSFDPNHPPELRWGLDTPNDNTAETSTPLRSGPVLSVPEAYRRGAYYRSLANREVGETPLATLPEAGFPVRQTMDAFLWGKWQGFQSPPLAPHGGRAAYERATARLTDTRP